MIVKCKHNQISQIPDKEVQEYIRKDIHLEGAIEPLEIEKEYAVQALARWNDNGVRVYLDNSESPYPHPYPIELFEITSHEIPPNWKVFPEGSRYENNDWKVISFPEWASDQHFFESLVDGDPKTTETWQKNKISD